MKKVFLFCLSIILFASCTSNDADEQDKDLRVLPVTLSFSSNMMSVPQQKMLSKGIGDPGDGDVFELPKYVYLYIFGTIAEDEYHESKQLLMPAGGNPVLLSTNLDDWSINANGNIYTYKHTIDILVGKNFKEGKAYVVASVDELTGIEPVGADDEEKEQDIKDKTFNFPTKCFTIGQGGTATDEATAANNRNRFLKNLYSSPINLFYEWNSTSKSYTIENGEYKIVAESDPKAQYYGTVLDAESKLPHVSIVLYHVAARLDVMWDAIKDNEGHEREDVRVTDIQIDNLRSKGCVLFLPTENEPVNDGNYSAAGGYSEDFLKNGNPSTYWQGRSVKYVIQQKSITSDNDHYDVPFTGKMKFKDTPVNRYVPLSQTIQITTPNKNIFTSWMRGYIEL